MNRSLKDNEPGAAAEGQLWRRVRAGRDPMDVPGALDPLLIAAYLDGTLDPQDRAAVEAWMADSPDGPDLVASARAELAETPADIPPRVLAHLEARARSLVDGTARRRTILRPVWRRVSGAWLGDLLRPAAWAGAAAAILLAAVSGFELGRVGTTTLAAAPPLTAEDGLGLDPPAEDLL